MKFVHEAAVTRQLVLSPDFRTFSMAGQYRELERRTGVDFAAVIELLETMPVFIDGSHHDTVRRAMARQIARTRECQFATARSVLDALCRRWFAPDSRLDLVEDFARPLWRAISSAIVPRSDETVQLVDDIPHLFRPLLSIRERLKINERIAAFLDAHRADRQDALTLLCLAALGARPFVGSLALSLYAIFDANADRAFTEIRWPEVFPESSLRYVDRICTAATTVAGVDYQPPDRVRCTTQSKDYSAADNREALFGFGHHTCLGKSTAERTWRMVVEKLSGLALRAECRGLTLAPHNDPFVMPGRAEIALTAAAVP